MAEDNRSIREGAGLVESRLNVEFIDWLRKWSTPMLAVVAVIALAYFAQQKVKERRQVRVAEAFSQLEQASSGMNPSPESLKAVAEEFGDVRAVGSLARLRAAETYLRAVRQGVKVSVNLDTSIPQTADIESDGTLKDATNAITEDDRRAYLAEVEALYTAVLNDNAGNTHRALLALQAAYGLAAVAESRGEIEKARAHYARAREIAAAGGFPLHVSIAQRRSDGVEQLTRPVRLYHKSELPAEPVFQLDIGGIAPEPMPGGTTEVIGGEESPTSPAEEPGEAPPAQPEPAPPPR